MEALPTSIIKYFSGFHQYLVPLFQRPYTWTDKQWRTLWEDIEMFFDLDPASRSTHFMVPLSLCQPEVFQSESASSWSIDGQQRLTTIALLLAAIRDELSDDDAPAKRRIQNHYLTNEGYDGLDYFKVLPTQGDRPAYIPLVRSSASVEPVTQASQFHKAYEFFRKKLRSERDSTVRPKHVLEIMETRLMVVMINLSDADDPYLIFESLNFKGSPLEQADLVRNYLLMRFPVSEQDVVYGDLWLPMQERLGSKLTEFMRHFLGSRGEEVRKGDVYASIKRLIAGSDSSGVRTFLTEMARLSVFYGRIATPATEPEPRIQCYFSRFERLDFGTVYPLLLALYDEYDRKQFALHDFADALAILESFIVRRMVVGVPSNSLSGLFISLSKSRPNEGSRAHWVASCLAKETRNRRWPMDAEFEDAWETRPVYGSRVCVVILERLEEQFGHRERGSFSDSTIEHVMPQTLTPDWESMLGDESEQGHSYWLHTIGNLTLTGYNTELGNKTFSVKKSIYLQSHYELNRYFAQSDQWRFIDISSRASVLFELAVKIWSKPASAVEENRSLGAVRANFHPDCIAKAQAFLRMKLMRRTTRRYESEEGSTRLFCAVSTAHNQDSETPYYWFGFPPAEQARLEDAHQPWICLGCGSADRVFLVPARKILELLPKMSVSTDAEHSHLVVHDKKGKYQLMLLGGVEGLELNEFLIDSPRCHS